MHKCHSSECCQHEKSGTRLVPEHCEPCQTKYAFAPYFRTCRRHKHNLSSEYQLLGQQTDYLLKHKKDFVFAYPDANLLLDIDGIDSEFLPDAFSETPASHTFMESVIQEASRLERSGVSRENALRWARCAVPQTTSRLRLIVDMAMRMDDLKQNIRMIVRLDLDGRHCNYDNAFLSIQRLRQDYEIKYILCGAAKAQQLGGSFYILFSEPIINYHPDHPNLAACMVIDEEYPPTLLSMLKRYAKSQETFYVYSFSRHDLTDISCPTSSAIKRCVVIEPRTRDCVVIRSRCLKKSQNREDQDVQTPG